ncbi:MAG: alpha/beta fold hydrolase [Bdellovibrionales bacterium]|nr:alpha/beta fold hydrolase [Bdellovibrionales bacterium]NQZ19970.1 alpha/beta fold hydrolase [Bdellovibrionales bacterium]
MKKHKVHFFHGFLGQKSDWDQVINHFNSDEVESVCHDLWEDFKALNSLSFSSWAEYKKEQLQSAEAQTFVGYSLGGRLLMHLDPKLYQNLILVASHPGLIREEDKKLREESDQKWERHFIEMEWKAVLDLWNGQEVFKYDRPRPRREESDYSRELLSKALISFSLSQQKLRDEYLLKSKDKIYWAIGSKDNRYSLLKDRITSLIGSDHVFEIEGAGHGCLFDEPLKVAQIIQGVL